MGKITVYITNSPKKRKKKTNTETKKLPQTPPDLQTEYSRKLMSKANWHPFRPHT